MTPHAHAASLLALALLAVTVGYILTCAVWPWKTCRRCQGTGTKGPNRRMLRHCRACHNTGLRIRLGRHIWNALRRIHHDTH